MRILKYLTIILLLTSVAKAQAQEVSPNDVIIEGKIPDFLMTGPEKIKIIFSISLFPATGITAPSTQYDIQPENNGRFKITFDSPAERFYMRVAFSSYSEYFKSNINNVYILEKGDRIRCKLSNGAFDFSGKGSEKLQCQTDIFKVRHLPYFDRLKLGKDVDAQMLDSLLKLRLEVVDRNAKKLSTEMKDIMIANCYGITYQDLLWSGLVFSHNRDNYRSFINSEAYRVIDYSLINKIDNEILANSPNYCDFLYTKLRIESLSVMNWETGSKKDIIPYMFRHIKENFSGVIRDKMLATFFLNNKVNGQALSFLEEALVLVKNQFYRKTLMNIQGVKSKGMPFYPFELENEKGNIIKLSDLKGKVVLLDFWFTGCGPCKLLNSAMAPVVDYYKNNSNVKFVSISIDAVKSMWNKSVATGDYTHSESINLFLGGKDAQSKDLHPMLKFYNITGFPTLFLLRDGKIYETGPPRPSRFDGGDVTKGDTRELISLINEALSIK